VKKSESLRPRSDSAEVLLELDSVAVRAGARLVVPALSWTIRSGEQWAVVGPNGSGKTSLARVAAGDLPSAGGKAFRAFGSNGRAAVGYVSFEVHRDLIARELWLDHSRYAGGHVSDLTTVEQLLAEAAMGRSTLRQTADLLGIRSILGRPFRHLSTGEMRKVLIARALVRDPELLVLDEPFDGLDSRSRTRLERILSDLIDRGLPLILVTHRIEEILAGVTHVLCLAHGRVVRSGLRDEVMQSKEVSALFDRVPESREPIDPESLRARADAGDTDARGPGYRVDRSYDRDGRAGEAGLTARRTVPTADPQRGLGSSPDGCAIIEFRDVTVRYRDVVVLSGLDWTMRRGESWAIVGPNGAGKTTILHLISADNLQGYANNIRLFGRQRGSGESIWDIKQRMGVVTPHLQVTYLKRLSGFDVVASGFFDSVGLYRRPNTRQRETAEGWIDYLGIGALANRPFDRLSYGERRLLLIARALVKSPEVLILDEPSQGLDPANRRRVLQVVEQVGAETDTDLLFVTHHREEVPACVTHVLELPGGGRPARTLTR
jgi:molybdate transport system ATP-binding protein